MKMIRKAKGNLNSLSVGLLALVGLCFSMNTAQAVDLPFDTFGYNDAAPYRIKVPANWNGTVLMYAHGYIRMPYPGLLMLTPLSYISDDGAVLEAKLLDDGYALAASAYTGAKEEFSFPTGGWAVKEGIEDTKKLTELFGELVATPNKVILWGTSMGSAVGLKSIEKHKTTYDGLIAMSHLGAGTTLNFDLSLDIALAYDVLFGWPEAWGTPGDVASDINFDEDVVPVVLGQLFNFLYIDGNLVIVDGQPVITGINEANLPKFEFLRRVIGLPLGTPEAGFYNGPQFTSFWIMAHMFFTTQARAEFEDRAGGPIAQNLDHTYTLSEQDRLELLYGLGLDATPLLAAMNARRNISAAPIAREYVKNYADYTGDLSRPVITSAQQGDGLTVARNGAAYEALVATKSKSALLFTTYTDGNFHHAGFTVEQLSELVNQMDTWIETNKRPNRKKAFPATMGFTNDFDPGVWPQPTNYSSR